MKGKVTDIKTGEPLIGATLIITYNYKDRLINKIVHTNIHGDYLLPLDKDAYEFSSIITCEVKISYIGYETLWTTESLFTTNDCNFELIALHDRK